MMNNPVSTNDSSLTNNPALTSTTASPRCQNSDLAQLQADHAGWKSRNLKLDLQRGKPSPEQLDLSEELLADPGLGHHIAEGGIDIRNYGSPDGLIELRRIFAELLNIPVTQLLAMGNGSLRLMYDTMVFALLFGVPGSDQPWISYAAVNGPIKFLCPTPGYDRHFAICEALGIEMIPIPILPDGPDVGLIESLVATDPAIKGMWLVPTYSNPTGVTISDAVANRLFSMPTAAPDFRIFWDDAYALHHLIPDAPPAHPVLELAAAGGYPDRLLIFASTSKITFASAGVAFVAASPANLAWLRERLGVQTIGPDKVNQLRHALYLESPEKVRALMARHREILLPKFATMDRVLRDRLAATPGIAHWELPKGGYFISLEVLPGTAKRVVELAADAGLALTPAGSAFPYGVDPLDTHIRLAPSMLSVAEVELATEVLAGCIKLAAAESVANASSTSPVTPVIAGLTSPVIAGLTSPVIAGSATPVMDGLTSPVIAGSATPVTNGLTSPVIAGLTRNLTTANTELLADFGDDTRTVPDAVRVARGDK